MPPQDAFARPTAILPPPSHSTTVCTRVSHPRRRPRATARAVVASLNATNNPPPPLPPPPQDSYLQCVECLAVYQVDPDELEGAPRVVACSACLHEWTVSDADLLWGHDEALAALEAAARRRVEGSAFVAARGVERLREKDAERDAPRGGDYRHTRRDNDRADRRRRDPDRLQRREDGRRRARVAGGGARGASHTRRERKHVGKHHAYSAGNGRPLPEADQLPNPPQRSDEAHDSEQSDDDSHFNVFVGNLSFRATEEDLYRAFSGYGAVLKCQVPADPSGASRGYGFVEMRSRESGLRAIESLQGTSILGRDVSLDEARPRRDKEVFRKRGGRRARETEFREGREPDRSTGHNS